MRQLTQQRVAWINERFQVRQDELRVAQRVALEATDAAALNPDDKEKEAAAMMAAAVLAGARDAALPVSVEGEAALAWGDAEGAYSASGAAATERFVRAVGGRGRTRGRSRSCGRSLSDHGPCRGGRSCSRHRSRSGRSCSDSGRRRGGVRVSAAMARGGSGRHSGSGRYGAPAAAAPAAAVPGTSAATDGARRARDAD